jgi:hypothetical protein
LLILFRWLERQVSILQSRPELDLLDLLGGSPSAQANLQVSTIRKIVETPSEYYFSMQEPHTRIFLLKRRH